MQYYRVAHFVRYNEKPSDGESLELSGKCQVPH